MNELYSSAIAAVAALSLLAACNDTPPAKNGGSPSIDAPQPAANAPSVNASDVKGPDLGGPAAKAPTVNGPDVKGPQMNGPSVNLYVDPKDRTDGGAYKK